MTLERVGTDGDDRKWIIFQSFWIVLLLIPVGYGVPIAFFYIGVRLRNATWVMLSVLYAIGLGIGTTGVLFANDKMLIQFGTIICIVI